MLSNDNVKRQRIENLRSLRNKKSYVPNIKARLWAIRLMDELNGKLAIKLPGGEKKNCKCTTLRPAKDNVRARTGATLRTEGEGASAGMNIMTSGRTSATLSPNIKLGSKEDNKVTHSIEDGVRTSATLSPDTESKKLELARTGAALRPQGGDDDLALMSATLRPHGEAGNRGGG